MAKIVSVVKTLRNNWKKTLFGSIALSFGGLYFKDKYDAHQLMRAYCLEALAFGHEPIASNEQPRTITVLLNPAANRRKAKANFEDYCAPILHLAGVMVNVVHTEHEGQVRAYLETFNEETDAIVVAGGDGTLSEAITGLLRRNEAGRKCPVGVIPLGRTNTIANMLFGNGCSSEIELMAKSTMAIVKEVTQPIDVVKIDVLKQGDTEAEGIDPTPLKPVYSIAGLHWGAFRDAKAKRDKYWYFGGLRDYASYIFCGLQDSETMSWQCKADMKYILPCNGCSKCYLPPINISNIENISQSRWWNVFRPRISSHSIPSIDYSKIENEECGIIHQHTISTVDLTVKPIQSLGKRDKPPQISIMEGPQSIGYLDFVQEGWRRVKGQKAVATNNLSARQLEIWPVSDSNKEKERWISIDLEDYEVKPIRLTLLPKGIDMFCNKDS